MIIKLVHFFTPKFSPINNKNIGKVSDTKLGEMASILEN